MKKSTLDSLPQDLIFHSNSFSSPTASNHHHQHHRHHTYIVSGVLQHYFDDNHLKTPRIEIQSWALKTKSATNLLLASPWESKNGTLKYFNYLETNIVTNSVILIDATHRHVDDISEGCDGLGRPIMNSFIRSLLQICLKSTHWISQYFSSSLSS